MALFNLLQTVPQQRRNVSARLVDKEANRQLAKAFGHAYFDGTREQGYGGYHYDGRWVAVAQAVVARYRLEPGQRVLDIGCAKGFLVYDLTQVLPGLDVHGLDISSYALAEAKPEIAHKLQLGNATALPFEDHSFDAVLSINTIHNLDRAGCIKALKEMTRVCRKPEQCFVQVDAYRNPSERELFEAWMLTAQTYGTPQQWHELFAEADYQGDYFWTILELNTTD